MRVCVRGYVYVGGCERGVCMTGCERGMYICVCARWVMIYMYNYFWMNTQCIYRSRYSSFHDSVCEGGVCVVYEGVCEERT